MKAGGNLDELAKKLGAKVVGRTPGAANAARLQFESAKDAGQYGLAREVASSRRGRSREVDPNFPVVGQIRTPESSGAEGRCPYHKLEPIKDGQGVIIGLNDTAAAETGFELRLVFLPPELSVAVRIQSDRRPPKPTASSRWETMLKGSGAWRWH
jgi:hypothetical protein